MYDEDNRYDLEDRNLGKWIVVTVVLGIVGALGFTMLRDQQDRTMRANALSVETTAAATIAPSGTAEPDELGAPTTTESAAPTTTTIASTPTTPTTTTPVVTGSEGATTTVAATPVPAPTTTIASPEPTAPTTEPTADLGYPAAPDGSPLPVIVSYDTGRVTLTGAVPSDDARARLVGLAQANSQEPDIEVIDNLFVNADVPQSVGVRVIEMNSARFGEGDAQLITEHTVQFDRVAAVLQALPHVSVLVIGHADQRGDDQRNRELSEDRASTVVDYLTYLGIDPTRLSMRGAGETDLLTLEDDASALALNRRTEFVFYGVLV